MKDLSENELFEFVTKKYKIKKDDIIDWKISGSLTLF